MMKPQIIHKKYLGMVNANEVTDLVSVKEDGR